MLSFVKKVRIAPMDLHRNVGVAFEDELGNRDAVIFKDDDIKALFNAVVQDYAKRHRPGWLEELN